MSPNRMVVAGVMSGTSADGINVALVQISESGPQKKSATAVGTQLWQNGSQFAIKLLGNAEYPYLPRIRSAILAEMNSDCARVADLSRLNFVLGELYAKAVLATERKFGRKVELVGCHGQTLYHQGEAQSFLGKKIAATWQTGEASIIAARVGVPVISDFRPADMAAGGKGAPLVPFLDYFYFRDSQTGRIALNLGGIANLTAIPAAAASEQVLAFDTGPGNMVMDAVMEELFHKPFDRNGKIAASGRILEPVLRYFLRGKFFRQHPPKTAGREEFGREFVRAFLRRCDPARKQDIVATATALTAQSIAVSIEKFVLKNSHGRKSYRQLIVSGGGSRNATLIRLIAERVKPVGLELRLSDEFGLPWQAKEAIAFAVLAYETWNRQPSNIPSATGANRPAILGKISYV
jgi:anhydro-N-acetylmuramic acid kinase